MGSNTILIPGGCYNNGCPSTGSNCGSDNHCTHWESENEPSSSCCCAPAATNDYLRKSNYLGEFLTLTEKEKARINLDVKSVAQVGSDIATAVSAHEAKSDPHGIIPILDPRYIKRDGSTPFTVVQKGVKGVASDDLIIREQLELAMSESALYVPIKGPDGKSLPLQYALGGLQAGSVLPEKISFQNLFDLALFGQSAYITAPEYLEYGAANTVKLRTQIKGSLLNITSIIVKRNGNPISSPSVNLYKSNGGVVTIDSDILDVIENVFTFEVSYNNGLKLVATDTTLYISPTFIGILPEGYSVNEIDYTYLQNLVSHDSVNNKFALPMQIDVDNYLEYQHVYTFDSSQSEFSKMQHICIMYDMETSEDLFQFLTISQTFEVKDFISVEKIFTFGCAASAKTFKMMIFKYPLLRLNEQVVFKFNQQ